MVAFLNNPWPKLKHIFIGIVIDMIDGNHISAAGVRQLVKNKSFRDNLERLNLGSCQMT